ncbi:MAG: hypothetical protein WD467_03250 [Candidatus Saccharimonadales bacterium]
MSLDTFFADPDNNRWVNAQSGSTVAWEQSAGPGDPEPLDLGPDFRTYVDQSGGQTIVIPNGTYSAGLLADATHDDWLILKAETPGNVVINERLSMEGCSRIVFVGLKFERELRLHAGSGWDNGNDRIISWYCQHSQAVGAGGGGENGIYWTAANARLAAVGCNIYDCYHDGIKQYSSDSIVQGCRIWNVYDPQNDIDPQTAKHNDTIQIETGNNIQILDSTLGLDLNGDPVKEGHVQIASEPSGSGVSASLERVWVGQSGSFGIMIDGKNNELPCHVDLTDIRSWNNTYGAYEIQNGATANTTNVLETAPSGSDVAPDTTWREANSYESYNSWIAGVSW